MSTCATCLPIDCNALVDDDLRLYSLQRTVFPVIISCPPGSVCTDASEVRIKCCETWLRLVFPAGTTAARRQELIQGIVNQCALISAACVENEGTLTPTVPDPPPGDTPIRRDLFYNRQVSRSSTCPDGTVFKFVVPAGTFVAQTQEIADAQAREAAILGISSQARFCPGGQPWFTDALLCVGNPSNAFAWVEGGVGPFTWQMIGGTLPTGTYFNPNTGRTIRLRGTPTTVGTFNFILKARNGRGGSIQLPVSIEVTEVTVAMSHADDSGGSNGTATATPTGVGPFTYLWSDGQTTQTATGLTGGTSPVGDYSVTVTDTDTGCTVEGSVHIDVGGCVPVVGVQVYTGAIQDPLAASWTVTGGTASQIGNDVFLTGSITEVYTFFGVGYDGVFDFTPVASCLLVLDIETYNGVTFLTGALPNLTFFGASFCPNITSLTLSPVDIPLVQTIALGSDDALQTVDISGLVNLTYFYCAPTVPTFGLQTFTMTGCVALNQVQCLGCNLDQASVDNTLIELAANGVLAGTVNLSGGTSVMPSGASAAAIVTLLANGWTVTTN